MLSAALIFTNQEGARLTKEDDLAAHRSGLLTIEALRTAGERLVRRFGDTAIVCVTTELAGTHAGQAFGGAFTYSRFRRRQDGAWRVEAGHRSAVTPSATADPPPA